MDTILDRHWGFGVEAEEVAKAEESLKVHLLARPLHTSLVVSNTEGLPGQFLV